MKQFGSLEFNDMRPFTRICLCLCFLLLGSLPAQGADRYITDVLVVTLRDGPSQSSNSIGYLRSGDSMTILEERENGYLRVHVSSGIEGWVPKKYTSVGKSKDAVIYDLKQAIASLEELNNGLKTKNREMARQVNDSQTSIDTNATREAKQQAHILDLEKQVAEAQDKYITLKDQSEGVEVIYGKLETLQQNNESLIKEVKVLKLENRELAQSKNIFCFLAGAGVLIVGWLIGRSGRKSRRSLTL